MRARGTCKSQSGENVSRWIWPSTADLGLRVMAPNLEVLFQEAALGILEAMSPTVPEAFRITTGEWHASLLDREGATDDDVLLLSWLDEVLFQAQHEHRWLVDVSVVLQQDSLGRHVRAIVSHTDGRVIERSVEVKAISSHGLLVREVQEHRTIVGINGVVPDLQGPAWYADILLDV